MRDQEHSKQLKISDVYAEELYARDKSTIIYKCSNIYDIYKPKFTILYKKMQLDMATLTF